MTRMARLTAGLGPASVAVHDDRYVAGNTHVVSGTRRAQTCRISFSLAAMCAWKAFQAASFTSGSSFGPSARRVCLPSVWT
jgi:hypothetical protein